MAILPGVTVAGSTIFCSGLTVKQLVSTGDSGIVKYSKIPYYADGLRPNMETACTYCGSDVYEHDAVFVEEARGDERESAGQFCNYACLATYIEENELTHGACCRIDL